ncbi:MAG: pyrimidine 5'-nucleotidase [Rubrivivax sp.]|nr:pyrimidine 5'-nucleotidase [Rubrivivax sp.]
MKRVWLFDLDDTLHDASSASMPGLHRSFGEYIQQHLGLTKDESDALRRRYWLRYGATLLGLVKHHAVDAAHFLHHTHLLPGLEQVVRSHAADVAVLRQLRGRKFILTNAPRAYAERVLGALGIGHHFEALISIEDMRMFGELRPKPDARMFRALLKRLRVPAARCVLVEDTLQHQKAARSVGMKTVWMQRWTRAAGKPGARFHLKPPYVDVRTRSLRALRSLR